MKIDRIEWVQGGSIEKGHFNSGDHLFLDLHPDKYQTISARLPNPGAYCTFAFIPNSKHTLECCDIHTTQGPQVIRDKDLKPAYLQHLTGFCGGTNSFDTRKLSKPTLLATLLLNPEHYADETTAKQARYFQEPKPAEKPAKIEADVLRRLISLARSMHFTSQEAERDAEQAIAAGEQALYNAAL